MGCSEEVAAAVVARGKSGVEGAAVVDAGSAAGGGGG